MGFFGGVFKVAGGLLAGPSERRGRNQLKQARKFEKRQKFVRAVQARRAFVAQARRAQAEATVAGATSGAALESSRGQASRASLKTQEIVGTGEQQDQLLDQGMINFFTESAKDQFQQAQDIQAAADAIGTIGDAVADLQGGGFGG